MIFEGREIMSGRIYVTFDKSQEDIPVLMTFQENDSFAYLGMKPSITVLSTMTGDEAIDIWNKLTKGAKKEK